MTAEIAPITPADIEQADATRAAEMVTAALVESRAWLVKAMEGTDPTPIAQFKAWAATVEEATKQKKLGREIELDAAEMVRRAERGIGVAIRKGQEAGEIAKPGDLGAPPKPGFAGGGTPGVTRNEHLVRPRQAAGGMSATELSETIYALTDGVTDETFEEAITEAKAEGNLSRANVKRKVKNKKQDDAPKPGERPEVLRKTRRINSERVIEQAVSGAGLPPRSVFDEVDYAALPDDRLAGWVDSLTSHITDLRSLRTRLMKEIDRRATA